MVELTDRQWDVVRLVGLGFTYAQIGEQLGISDRTVEAHVTRIAEKLGPGVQVKLPAHAVRDFAHEHFEGLRRVAEGVGDSPT